MLLSIRNKTIHWLFQGWPWIPFAGSLFSLRVRLDKGFKKSYLRVLLVMTFCSLGPLRGGVWCFQTAGIAYKELFARVERELWTEGRLCRGWVMTQLHGKSLVRGDSFWKPMEQTLQSPSSGKKAGLEACLLHPNSPPQAPIVITAERHFLRIEGIFLFQVF